MKKNLGVLCAVSSLPSKFGIGDLGKTAQDFIYELHKHNFNIWQILPINLTNEFNCPYSTIYTFAIDPMLVDPIGLLEIGLIKKTDIKVFKSYRNTHKVDYFNLKKEKAKLLDIAFNNVTDDLKVNVKTFIKNNTYLKEYAEFISILNYLNIRDWRKIPKELQIKTSKEYKEFVKNHTEEIEKHEFIQYILYTQWQETLNFAHSLNIKILGDVPIYPDKNSLDVYLNKDLFKLDKNFNPRVTGGVPPDDFCADGQNWGTCIYDWEKLEKQNFDYYIEKLKNMLKFCDILRLDHFAGYVEHYEVNNEDKLKSKWVKGGGEPLFDQIVKRLNLSHFVIEDLGVLTDDCITIRSKYDLVGMIVLQFALTDKNFDINKIRKNSILFLGTHDNNTFMGYLNGLKLNEKANVCKALDIPFGKDEEILINSIKKILKSPAKYVIFQLQDLLLQPESERMNIPGITEGVWEYKAPIKYKKKLSKTINKIKKDIKA